MSFFDSLRYRLRAITRSSTRDREIAEEFQHHLDLEANDLGTGADADDDSRRWEARRRFGNATYAAEERRRISGIAGVDALRQDVRFIARLLRRRLGFAIVTVSTIALGIAAATSIYSVADAVLFRPLAFPNANELITVWLTRPRWKTIPGLAKRWDRGTVALPSFRRWRAAQRSFVDVGAWESMSAMVGDASSSPDEMLVARATASLFAVLGLHPELGSWFSESDDVSAGAPVAVVSHETWVARFGGDPRVLGRIVDIDGKRHTIVGVAPKGFSLDRGPITIAYWLPAAQDTASARDNASFAFQVIGRIKPGASIPAAAAEAARIIRDGGSDDRIEGTVLTPLHDDQTRSVRRPLLLLLAASGLLLLIACINVATLLLGEAVGREHELRTRAALGAGRGRLLRQLLTESVVLSGVGAVVGAALANVTTRVLVRTAPASIPGLADAQVNARVLSVALIAAIVTGVLFGLVPAVTLVRRGAGGLGAGSRHSTRGRERTQRLFIACEVALSMVLLIGGGLLVRSFSKLSSVGFDPEGMFVVSLRFPQPVYPDSDHVRSVIVEVEQRLRTLPWVIAAGATTLPPFSTGSSSTSIEIEGRPVSRTAPGPAVNRRVTTPAFFATARVSLVSGRLYGDADRAGAPLVVVISRTMAEREWPGRTAVGKRIKLMETWRTVIGVVDDIATERPSADPPDIVYAPLAQLMLRSAPWMMIRTRDGANEVLANVRSVVTSVESDVVVNQVASVRSLVDDALADDRLRTVLISLFASIAALLAAIGTYGVASTAANRRTREMAIRVAVGATNGSIARLIIGGAATGVAIGAMLGVGLALLGSRALMPYLYGVGAGDPRVYASVALLLAVSTLGATWFPARRAMRVRLVETLSAE
jgi:putative ABC transport system permease protein